MKIEFLTPANEELKEAIEYYNLQKDSLGYEFASEVQRTVERIIQYPKAWSKLSNRARRCRTNRFPFGLIYQVRKDSIIIVAVMHLNRNPNSWKNRL